MGKILWKKINNAAQKISEANYPDICLFQFDTRAAEPDLFNKEGLPASSYRTDDWKIKLK
jgi:hypothetical protein